MHGETGKRSIAVKLSRGRVNSNIRDDPCATQFSRNFYIMYAKYCTFNVLFALQ